MLIIWQFTFLTGTHYTSSVELFCLLEFRCWAAATTPKSIACVPLPVWGNTKTHPSIHFVYLFICSWVTGAAGASPSCQGAGGRVHIWITGLTLKDNNRSHSHLSSRFLDCGRKLEWPRKPTHTQGEHANSTQSRDLNSVNHNTTPRPSKNLIKPSKL